MSKEKWANENTHELTIIANHGFDFVARDVRRNPRYTVSSNRGAFMQYRKKSMSWEAGPSDNISFIMGSIASCITKKYSNVRRFQSVVTV